MRLIDTLPLPAYPREKKVIVLSFGRRVHLFLTA
jgi:hypothetical protein